MWISVPTPETTSIMVTESVSTRKAQGTLSAPTVIQSARWTTTGFRVPDERDRQQHRDDERQPGGQRCATTPAPRFPEALADRSG